MPSPNGKSRLVYTLETQVNEAETSSYEVNEQMERNMRYYSLQPLGNEQKGRSHYISPDVLDAVEGKKALFSETFLSGRDVVAFTNCTAPNEAEAKTAYANKALTRNQADRLFRDGWHDAFVTKRMVVLAEWYEDTKETTMNLPGVPMPLVQQQLQQMGDVLEVDDSKVQVQAMPSPQGVLQVMSGELTLTMNDGYVRLSLIQPERYFRDPNVAYEDQAQWTTIEEDLARGQLIDMGYDTDQVMSLTVDYRFRSDEVDSARKRHDSSWTRRQQQNRIEEQEAVSYYRTWTWLIYDEETFAGLDLDFEPRPGYRLYEIHWAHGEILRWAGDEENPGKSAIREVPETGIFEWTEMPISHAENGMCTADVLVHIQKSQSGLKRLVYDNQQMANSSRNILLAGALKNPRDLLDNKIGATLVANRSDAVTPLPPPPLSPLTMQTIAMFKADGEERSGLSGLAKGMNTDAVKYQNADNMIERLTSAGQRRVTAEARDFANTFLIPLCQYIVHLGMRNDTAQSTMEVAGQQVPIVPAQWRDDELCMEAAVALTPEEGQRTAQQLMMIHSTLTQDPTMGVMYGPQQKHAQLDMIYDLLGISDTTKLLLPPGSPEYQQASQQQAQQAQVAQQKQDQVMAAQLMSVQTQNQVAMSGDQRAWAETQWNRTNDMADNMLNEEKHEWDIERETQELQIERQQKRPVSAT